MKKNEKYTIVIAVIALILSVINTYYQFFNVKHDLIVSVLNVERIPNLFLLPDNNKKIEAMLLFINNGNRYEAISNAKFVYSPEKDFKITHETKLTGTGPIILTPGEKKLVKIEDSLDVSLLISDKHSSKLLTLIWGDYDKKTREKLSKYDNKIFVGISIRIILPSGDTEDVLLRPIDISLKDGKFEKGVVDLGIIKKLL